VLRDGVALRVGADVRVVDVERDVVPLSPAGVPSRAAGCRLGVAAKRGSLGRVERSAPGPRRSAVDRRADGAGSRSRSRTARDSSALDGRALRGAARVSVRDAPPRSEP